jgi:phenylacetate-CoA ligase
MSLSLEDRLHGHLSGYIGAPQWLKSLLGTAYRQLPLGLRRGRAYKHYQSVLAQLDHTKVADYARTRLAETMRWAVETVPAYAYLRAAVADEEDPYRAIGLFPPTDKADIKAVTSRYMSTAIPAEKRLQAFTGGSTAEPMQFYLEKDVSRPREYAFMEDFHARLGHREGDLVLALRGRSVPGATEPGGRLWMYEPIKRQLILSSDHLLGRWMPEYIEALRKWRPRFIQAFPSALYPMARWLAENPAPDSTASIRGVMLYSENVYDYQMRLFRQVFGCPVLKHYGHSERVLMAASLPDDERYFFWPQYGHVELLDTNGQPISEPGVLGEIVGTSFDNRVMPFIRYRTGDLAMWSAEPSPPSLLGYPVVERIEGRLQEFVVCHDGRLVSICTLGAAHFEELAQVSAIQYEQTVPGRLTLKVVASSRLSEESRRRIATAIENKTQGGCVAEVVEVDDIPRTRTGKHVMLIQGTST